MANLMRGHNEWARRPNDERFWSLDDLAHSLDAEQNVSREVPCSAKVLTIGTDGADLFLQGKERPAFLNHWSFDQLCGIAGAPASYMRRLDATLAAQCLNVGLQQYASSSSTTETVYDEFLGEHVTTTRGGASKSVQLLFKGQDIRSITTDSYSRLWDIDLVRALRPATEAGWMVPPARPARHDPRARPATLADIVPGQDNFSLAVKEGDMIAPAGVYRGDRDIFIFLVDPTRIIDDGVKGLMRGIFITNSEVKARAFNIQTFFLENVCGNHIVWGASEVKSHRIVHMGKNFNNPQARIHGKLKEIESAPMLDVDTINAARTMVLGKNREEVVETIYNNKRIGLGKKVIDAAYTVAIEYEDTAKANPNTVWGMVHGLTRYSQGSGWADDRHTTDSAAGKLLALAN